MPQTPELALALALIALFGVLVNALVAANNARKRGELDAKLLELKSKLDQFNALELARIQAEHGAKLKALEFDRTQHAAAEERCRSADSSTFNKILETLDQDQVISFLRTHDFNGTYDRNESDPILRFIDLSKRPDSEFLNPELENLRTSLFDMAKTLAGLLAIKTHPRQNTFSSVLPESLVNHVRPAWVDENADEINDCATSFVEIFEKLVRHARLTLGG